MNKTTEEKYGFVYIWMDRKHKRFYVGCHWGYPNDGYICSSRWMRKSYKRRPEDFKRRIISKVYTNRTDLLEEEFKWLSMIKPEELGSKYYNIRQHHYGHWINNPDYRSTIEKIKASQREALKRPEVQENIRKGNEKKKGLAPWNKGLTKETNDTLKEISRKVSTTLQGNVPWNKGLTNKDDDRIKCVNILGYKHTEEQNKAKSERQKNKPQPTKVGNNFRAKVIQTPSGVFPSAKAASEYYLFSRAWIHKKIKTNPTEWYYI